MKRKIAAVSAAILSAALVFSACGSGNSQASSEQSAKESTEAGAKAEDAADTVLIDEMTEEELEEALEEAAEELEEEADEDDADAADDADDEDDPDDADAADDADDADDAKDDKKDSKKDDKDADDADEGNAEYAWLGLEAMPECDYMDALAGYHYIETYDTYVMGFKTEETYAVDGADTVKLSDTQRTYNIDGQAVSINESSKIYMESDMTSIFEGYDEKIKQAQEDGENMFGRAFVEKGKGVIPLYSEDGDDAEYEYYEFNYPQYEEMDMEMIERYYMKDGDVFAIYTCMTSSSGSETETVKVIKSMSDDIPEGTFEYPDLTGYELYEI